ncbi:hypothetical protein M408DRAFT_263822 [Serendipita vermifera MAFF 305830]|uniref:Uncharacterized protein n=1 Tax=Serendipita vermifera MAFF 305830 TaxID=933852 RepID=A0A0C3AVQ5_SERVB|nr:hypothetical protein M408DRAFT_263822 [Serendipita vermifera MAFF 305830]
MEENQSRPLNAHALASYVLSPFSAFHEWYFKKGPEMVEDQNTHEPPYVASAAFGVSFISQIRAFLWNDGMVQKGYEQYPEGIFKMPALGSWVTIVTGKYLDEVLRAPETSLSFQKLLNDSIQLEYLIGPELSHDLMHLNLIKTLNRNLSLIHTEIADEVPFALDRELSKASAKDGWMAVKCVDFTYYTVLRVNLRAYVGLPLCRDDAWIKAIEKDAMDFGMRAWILRAFPTSKRTDACIYLSRFGLPFQAATKSLTDAINQRLSIPEEERPVCEESL